MFNLCFPGSLTSTDNYLNLSRNVSNVSVSNITQQPLTNDFSNSSSTLYELGKELKKELEKESNLIEKYLKDNNMNNQYFVDNIYDFILF